MPAEGRPGDGGRRVHLCRRAGRRGGDIAGMLAADGLFAFSVEKLGR